MKKTILSFMSLAVVFGLISLARAEQNSVTPSTNDINTAKGWAHVHQVRQGVGTTDLEFTSLRNFYSCFEYRTDGDTSQKTSDTNYNPNVTDGLYPYYCQKNNSSTHTILANEYVEVRMVFGAETDERFDWTRFDVIYPRTATITSPEAGQVVSGLVDFEAVLDDKDGNDNVQWAVRQGTCAAGTGTVLGNVDGHNDSYTWDGANFSASADVTSWADGNYCFVFNPTESAGDVAIRETREFVVSNPPTDKEQCKQGGWQNFLNPTFKNQGDCVSYVQSNPKAKGNRKNN